jgi:F-type H+-transporting ATPase subunit b
MLIDWFTVCAQAANFLILVWLLKRFLYKPVLAAIAAREKLISDQLQDAAAKKLEAQKERDDFQHKNEEFDQQRVALLSKATDEVKTERQKLLDVARKDSETLRLKLQESVKDERENLNREIMARTQQEVFAITRKALSDLSSTTLEASLGEMFVRRLRALDEQTKEKFVGALKASSEPTHLRSAFDLTADQKAAIQNALNEMVSAEVQIRFEMSADLICGIELLAGGQKISWSIADYLGSLEKSLGEILNLKTEPDPADLAQSK